MRYSLLTGALLAVLALFSWAAPARAQIPFDVTALMQDINQGITQMTQDMLADNRVAELKDQGLIVAPLQANIPDADEGDGDDFIGFLTVWAQEKMLTAMIRQDEDAHFAVLDRVMLEAILQDNNLAPESLHNPRQWPVIGKAANAQYILTGSFSVAPMTEKPLQLAISVTARIVNLETGRGIAAGTFDIVFKQPEPAFGIEQ